MVCMQDYCCCYVFTPYLDRGLVGVDIAYHLAGLFDVIHGFRQTRSLQGICVIWEQRKQLSSTSIWLLIRIDLFQSHRILSSRPPTPVTRI